MCSRVLLLSAVAYAAQAQSSGSAGLLSSANAVYQEQRFGEAILLYREYLSKYSDRADVRVFLGAALFGAGHPKEAMEQVERALEIDSRYAKAYTLAGRIHTYAHNWDLARAAYQSAVRIAPRDREAWYFAARGYYEENVFELAIEAFERAIALGARDARVHWNLGLAYEALGRHQEAEEAYKRAIAVAANDYQPYLAYGTFLYKQGRTRESLQPLAAAYRRDPNSEDVRFAFGRTLYSAGKLDEALDVVTNKALDSMGCRLQHLLFRIYSALGKPMQPPLATECWPVVNR